MPFFGQRLQAAQAEKQKSPQDSALQAFQAGNEINYLILASLYITCLRTTGSNFLISIFSGMVRLFLSVV